MIKSPPSHTPLRVLFCTTPSIYSTSVLLEFIKSPHLELVGVVASSRILRKKGWAWWDAVQLVRKTGLRYAAYLWAVTALYGMLRNLLRNDPIRKYLLENKVPVYTSRDINSSEGVLFIKKIQPDLLLSAHFNQLIGSEILALPAYGCLNIHPGLLPQYKGVDPVIHALAAGEHQYGVTVHFQDQGFDTGPVIVSGSLQINDDDSLLTLNCRLFQYGMQLLLGALSLAGTVPSGITQEKSDSYDSWPNSALVGKVCKSSRRLLNFKDLLVK